MRDEKSNRTSYTHRKEKSSCGKGRGREEIIAGEHFVVDDLIRREGLRETFLKFVVSESGRLRRFSLSQNLVLTQPSTFVKSIYK